MRQDKWEPYATLRRSRDLDEGITHLKDPLGTQLALCGAGFAASRLDMDVKHDAVPTCVFCVCGVKAKLQHWRLLTPCHRKRIIEEARRGS